MPQTMNQLVCVECLAAADVEAHAWRAYICRDPDETDDEPQVVFYCPDCAGREFGDR